MVYRGSQNAWLLVCKSSNEKPCDDLQMLIPNSPCQGRWRRNGPAKRKRFGRGGAASKIRLGPLCDGPGDPRIQKWCQHMSSQDRTSFTIDLGISIVRITISNGNPFLQIHHGFSMVFLVSHSKDRNHSSEARTPCQAIQLWGCATSDPIPRYDHFVIILSMYRIV